MGLFQKATRKKAKLRLALTGVTGAGKTLSALYLAYGITGDWGKIAVIDTEHERARFYASRNDLETGEFLYLSFEPPYSAEKYKQYVCAGAEAVGSDGVVLIDSLSHAWSNEGGVLEYKDSLINPSKGINNYTAWNQAGKVQNSLINTILSADCHTIVTMRSKMDYILVENEKGKQQPQKVGLQPIQRDDTEYEFDIVLDIDRDHKASVTKDTTFLGNFNNVLTPQIGLDLKEWLDQGVDDANLRKITIGQRKEMLELANKDKSVISNIIAKHGYKSTADITQNDYVIICNALREEKKGGV